MARDETQEVLDRWGSIPITKLGECAIYSETTETTINCKPFGDCAIDSETTLSTWGGWAAGLLGLGGFWEVNLN